MSATSMETIGKYKILEKLGEGGMGRVDRAVDTVLNRHVAIKTISMRRQLNDDAMVQEMRERFMREARLVGSLQHPNIVTLFDFGETGDTLYMVMELLEGTDLKQFIEDDASPSVARKIEVFKQICRGLAYAHTHGVIHRDLKPSNIRILPSGTVKILDFGLARPEESNLTKSGVVIGTPHYMSPEQIRGTKMDHRVDVFSLGTLMYEVFTGLRPFAADTTPAVLRKIVTSDPPPVRTVEPSLPLRLDAIIRKCLSKNPEARYATVAALSADLDRLDKAETKDEPVTTKKILGVRRSDRSEAWDERPPSAPRASRISEPRVDVEIPQVDEPGKTLRHVLWGAFALIIVVFIVGAVIAYRARRPGEPEPPPPVETRKPVGVSPDPSSPDDAPEATPTTPPPPSPQPGEPAGTTDATAVAQAVPSVEQPLEKSPDTTTAPAEPPPALESPVASSPTAETPPPPAQEPAPAVQKPTPPPAKPPAKKPAVTPRTPPPEPAEERSTERFIVDEALAEVKRDVGSVHIRIVNLPPEPKNLAISIDGDGVVTSNPADFMHHDLSPGVHQVVVRCDGFETSVRTLNITSGSIRALDITLVPVKK